jgi:ribose transport system substrate-binding protein
MKPALLALWAVLSVGALASSACKRDHGAAGGGADPAGRSDAPGAGKPIRIAMIGKSSTNPVFLSARTGAEVTARELGARIGVPVEIVWLTPPQEDGRIQAQRIAQAVSEGASALLVSCSDAAVVTPAIDDAVARGVPVMTFDSDAPQSRRFAYYGVDDHRLGTGVMTELATLLGGRGKVAVLSGNLNAPNLRRRVDAVKEVAAHHPGLQVVGVFHSVETPQDAAAEVIRVNNSYPEIKGWAMVGGWALFTKTLLNELDPKKTKIVAVDALPPELPYVEKGLAPMLLAQSSYLWGSVGVTKIVDKIFYQRDVPAIIPMDPVKVTRESLGTWSRQLKQWGFADVPEEYLKLP